jgi:hypothetical protein
MGMERPRSSRWQPNADGDHRPLLDAARALRDQLAILEKRDRDAARQDPACTLSETDTQSSGSDAR